LALVASVYLAPSRLGPWVSIDLSSVKGLMSLAWLGIQLPRKTSMSLFFIEVKVTGSDRTVTEVS